jgi:hypothetical protein
MNITPKYSFDDLVVYEGVVYKVTRVYALNWFMNSPFVYGLVLAHTHPKEPLDHKEFLVIEQLLKKATPEQVNVWMLLYGAD